LSKFDTGDWDSLYDDSEMAAFDGSSNSSGKSAHLCIRVCKAVVLT
jgi:hypothetical protein